MSADRNTTPDLRVVAARCSGRVTLGRAIGSLLPIVALVARIACQDQDLGRASTAELLRIFADATKGIVQAFEELNARPRAVVSSELRALLPELDTQLRCAALSLLDVLLRERHRWPPDARRETEATLHDLLGDAQERVRSGALYALGHGSWAGARPDRVEPMVTAAVASLLESADPRIRFQAALTASWIGPAAESAAPILVAKLPTEPDGRARFAMATALQTTGRRHGPAAEALLAAMEDPYENVRCAAAGTGTTVSNPNEVSAPPGYSMPFAVTSTGVPSEAGWVRLGG